MNFRASLNINDYVYVRLTDLGRAEHERICKEIAPNLQYIPPKDMGGGWTEWQLWVLMHYFGHMLHNGADKPFESEILLTKPEYPDTLNSLERNDQYSTRA